jgi:acetyl esterase
MILDPDAQRVLDLIKASGRPPLNTLSVAEARSFFDASRTILQPDPPDVADVRDITCPGSAGPIALRIYRPLGSVEWQILPVLIYFHGGGWVLGDLDSHDVACRRLANDTPCCVISVDYRLAPEHKFPAAVSDSAAATRWIINSAEQLAIDPTRVAVGGDSAGGNLAAVMALMARDTYLPPIACQMLIYPATDMAMQTVSSQRIAEGYPLVSATMQWFIDHYLRGPEGVLDWRASPLRAVSLAGAAPAFVVTCAHDPLADEGAAYARRLEAENVRVTHLHVSDQAHGFLTWGKLVRASDTLLNMLAASLRARFAELAQ